MLVETLPQTIPPYRLWCTADRRAQIPGQCTVEGDIRLIPFYTIEDAVAVVEAAVQELSDAQFTCGGPNRATSSPSPRLFFTCTPTPAPHGAHVQAIAVARP